MQFNWNGRTYNHDISQYKVSSVDGKSSLHVRAYNILRALFKFDTICQEVPAYGTRSFIDLYLPNKRLAIECQGQQHYEQNNFFHKSKTDFIHGQVKDKVKKSWCEANDITLVCLDYRETDEQWTRAVLGYGPSSASEA